MVHIRTRTWIEWYIHIFVLVSKFKSNEAHFNDVPTATNPTTSGRWVGDGADCFDVDGFLRKDNDNFPFPCNWLVVSFFLPLLVFSLLLDVLSLLCMRRLEDTLSDVDGSAGGGVRAVRLWWLEGFLPFEGLLFRVFGLVEDEADGALFSFPPSSSCDPDVSGTCDSVLFVQSPETGSTSSIFLSTLSSSPPSSSLMTNGWCACTTFPLSPSPLW